MLYTLADKNYILIMVRVAAPLHDGPVSDCIDDGLSSSDGIPDESAAAGRFFDERRALGTLEFERCALKSVLGACAALGTAGCYCAMVRCLGVTPAEGPPFRLLQCGKGR